MSMQLPDVVRDGIRNRKRFTTPGLLGYYTHGRTYMLGSPAHWNDDGQVHDLILIQPDGTVIPLRPNVNPDLVEAVTKLLAEPDDEPSEPTARRNAIISHSNMRTIHYLLEPAYQGHTSVAGVLKLATGELTVQGQDLVALHPSEVLTDQGDAVERVEEIIRSWGYQIADRFEVQS